MIITFKSRASGDVIMFGDVAHNMIKIMGKEADNKGIITVEQLPAAIAQLHAAISSDKAQRPSAARQKPEDISENDSHANVTVAQRAVPLLELLEQSLKAGKPVIWE